MVSLSSAGAFEIEKESISDKLVRYLLTLILIVPSMIAVVLVATVIATLAFIADAIGRGK